MLEQAVCEGFPVFEAWGVRARNLGTEVEEPVRGGLGEGLLKSLRFGGGFGFGLREVSAEASLGGE